MTRAAGILTLVATLALSPAASAAEPRNWDQESWEGYGPGSWVHTRRTVTAGAASSTRESRVTLLRIEEGQFVLKSERKEAGRPRPPHRRGGAVGTMHTCQTRCPRTREHLAAPTGAWTAVREP